MKLPFCRKTNLTARSCFSPKSVLTRRFEDPAAAAKLLQSCPTLCDPLDGSPPGSSIHGICQARILEWFEDPTGMEKKHM